MKTLEIIKFLERSQRTIFGAREFAKIIKKPINYSILVLHRLKKKGFLVEIERNKYALKENISYLIFTELLYPSYISFLTALHYYNLTTLIPKKVQIVGIKSKKEISFDDYLIKFIKFKQARFFGYQREKTSNGFIFIAEIEKAIIDSLYLPKYCPIDEVYNALSEGLASPKIINIKKLIDYALRMNSKVILKRLGYLLELKKIDCYKEFKDKINKKYDFLDVISKKGERNKKWKLIINRELE